MARITVCSKEYYILPTIHIGVETFVFDTHTQQRKAPYKTERRREKSTKEKNPNNEKNEKKMRLMFHLSFILKIYIK